MKGGLTVLDKFKLIKNLQNEIDIEIKQWEEHLEDLFKGTNLCLDGRNLHYIDTSGTVYILYCYNQIPVMRTCNRNVMIETWVKIQSYLEEKDISPEYLSLMKLFFDTHPFK